jgi:DUF4097 and DUF4098 domain-containing protein YvlB
MKKLALVSAVGLLSLSAIAGTHHTFERTLSLNTDRLSGIEMDVGAGSLEVVGVSGNEIKVYATIESEDYRDMEDLMEAFEDKMKFELSRGSGYAELKARRKSNSFSWGNKNIAINLQVEVPKSMDVEIDDGSGPMTVENINGTVKIDDGSGPITIRMIGNDVKIDDGSGPIRIGDIKGDVKIDDGSGGIEMKNITGSVDVEDGSGEITAKDIGGNFTVDDGSGSVIVKDLQGKFELIDDGSGSIKVNGKTWDSD